MTKCHQHVNGMRLPRWFLAEKCRINDFYGGLTVMLNVLAMKWVSPSVCLVSIVFWERGQIWRGDQSPEWQTEGGEPISGEAEQGCCVCVIYIFIVFLFVCFKAETRAEFAERTVAKLEKTIDDLEGRRHFNPCFFGSCAELCCLKSTFVLILMVLNP